MNEYMLLDKVVEYDKNYHFNLANDFVPNEIFLFDKTSELSIKHLLNLLKATYS